MTNDGVLYRDEKNHEEFEPSRHYSGETAN